MPYDASSDPYAQRSTGVNSYARGMSAIVPSDTVDLPTYAKALYIAAAGTISFIPIANYAGGSSSPITLISQPAGTIIPVQVARVLATGTSATVMGLYN